MGAWLGASTPDSYRCARPQGAPCSYLTVTKKYSYWIILEIGYEYALE